MKSDSRTVKVWKIDYDYQTENSYPLWLSGTNTYDDGKEMIAAWKRMLKAEHMKPKRAFLVTTEIQTSVFPIGGLPDA